MVMKSLTIIACLLSFAAVSCTSTIEEKRIEDGVYLNPSKLEMVEVRGRTIEFKIRVSDDLMQQRNIHRKYQNYTLLANGSFWPTPTVSTPIRSADYLFGVGRFEWFWDGTHITQKNPKTGGMVTFAREGMIRRNR